ncbi:UbiA family prenyltransferase [Pendulispora brunnea]|uniref:UbiA family prenyltransferase n=1 Tax=Pendulispora brunnea TaxID=2905690 RepID=A0ABZ2KE47_9BACT
MSWRIYLRLGRVSNLPTVWSNTLAGVALAQAPNAAWPVGSVAVLMVAFSLLYIGGMFLNDAFDRHIDARERANRPIPSGQIGAREVFAIGFGLLGAGVLAVAVHAFAYGAGVVPIVSAVVLAGIIVLYDAWHKGNPIGPIIMGACRVLVYVTAALSVTMHRGTPVFAGAALLLSYLIGLTYLAKHEGAYLAGKMPRFTLRRFWPLALLFIPCLALLPISFGSTPALLLDLAFLAWIVFTLVDLRRGAPGAIPRTVVRLIAGISLLDAVLVGPSLGAALALGAFALTLWLQRFVSGT